MSTSMGTPIDGAGDGVLERPEEAEQGAVSPWTKVGVERRQF